MRRALLAVVAAAAAVGAAVSPVAAAVVLEQGHADLGVRVVGGVAQGQVKDGTSGAVVWREPADVVVRLTATARATVPSGPAYGFLGAPGARTWLIPQTQKADVVWLGWNTEELGGGQASGTVGWSLDAVEGPGAFALFVTNAFGAPQVLMNSGDGLPDVHQIALGTHAHGNWAFSQPGTYALTFTHRVQTAAGVQADTERLVVEVADVAGGGTGGGGGAGGGVGAGSGGGAGGAGTGGSDGPGGGAGEGGSGRGGSGGGPAGGSGSTPAPSAAIAVVGRTVRLRADRTIPVRIRCRVPAGSCRGTVVLRTTSRVSHRGARHRLTLGRRAYRVAAGRSATVAVPVTRAVARTLRARRSTALTATVTRAGGSAARAGLRLARR